MLQAMVADLDHDLSFVGIGSLEMVDDSEEPSNESEVKTQDMHHETDVDYDIGVFPPTFSHQEVVKEKYDHWDID